jgi:hypothetical protein
VVHPVMYMPLSTFFTMSATPQAAMLSATIPAPYAIWRQQDVSSPAQCCNCIQDKSVTAPPPFSDISPQYSIAMPGFFMSFCYEKRKKTHAFLLGRLSQQFYPTVNILPPCLRRAV